MSHLVALYLCVSYYIGPDTCVLQVDLGITDVYVYIVVCIARIAAASEALANCPSC